jgi:hypothetical protein
MKRLMGSILVRLDSKVVVIRSQEGFIFCGWNVGSSFKWGRVRRGSLRYDLILQTGEEEDRNLGDGRQEGVGCPDLVAEECEVPCWRDDTFPIS